MTIFEKMLTDEYKRAFIEKNDNKFGIDDEYKNRLLMYITGEKCDEDIKSLIQGDFIFSPPVQHLIRKSHSTKRRKVYSFPEQEKFLLKYITFVLMDFDDIHADSLCSFRKDNRVKSFFRTIKKIDPKRELYVLTADISDYGGSVDQDICMEIAGRIFPDDPDFMRFLIRLMTRNEFYVKGELKKERVSIIEGLPMGNFLNNIYLGKLDQLLEPVAVCYMRYADDMAFFTDSKEKAIQALDIIKDQCRKLKLSLNEEKTKIIMPGEDVDVLGIKIYNGGFDIAENSMQKLMSKMKRYRDRQLRRQRRKKTTPHESLEAMIGYYDRTFFGKMQDDHEFNWVIHAFPIITRTDGLHRIDAYVQDCLRVVGSGKMGNSKYRVKYSDMVAGGYKNLVSSYYHGYEISQSVTTNME